MSGRLWAILAFGTLVSSAGAQTVTDSSLGVTTYRTGFSSPTGFTFLPDNRLFVIEKATGRVRLVSATSSTATTALDLAVNSNSERGLLGIALDPDFATNQFVYLYYSVNSTTADSTTESEWTQNRLSRFTFNGSTLGSESILQTFTRDANQANGANHDGGPILFGPDKKLYGITGDLNRALLEQNQGDLNTASSGVGGLYRLESNGAIPTDNPFATNANTSLRKWFAYGIRNSFGLAVDPMTGALWDTENGPESFDEINRVAKGFNSGWSDIMGPDDRDPQNVSNLIMLPGAAYSDPEFSFVQPIGITDLEFMAKFDYDVRYENAVVFGGSNGTNANQIYLLRLNPERDGFALTDLVADDDAERNSLVFGSNFGVTTDIQIGPDHAMYVLSLSSGALFRIAPNVTSFVLGDLNGDNHLDNFDIQAFELALVNPSAYRAAFPGVVNYKLRGDTNGDGTFDNFDIQSFEGLLTSGPLAPVPEPASIALAAWAGLALVFAARRPKGRLLATARPTCDITPAA